jgi:hypothetical protein
MLVLQDGDEEGSMIFDPSNPTQAKSRPGRTANLEQALRRLIPRFSDRFRVQSLVTLHILAA